MPNPIYSVSNVARFAVLLAVILVYEGSVFTDDPDDRGGPTRYGCTQARYDQYRKDTGKPTRSVRYIEMPEVEAIYARYYWRAIDADNLPMPLDFALFNVAVNSGPARAAQFLKEVRVKNPGADALTLARAVCDRYERFYRAIVANNPSQVKFLRGWLNRLNDVRQRIEETVPLATGETWEVYRGETQLEDARQNEGDGRAWVRLRQFLQYFFAAKEVGAKLDLKGGEAYWDGKKMPVDEQQWPTPSGVYETWVPVRQVAGWLGLEADADGKTRQIVLTRPVGAAKAEG